MYTEQDLKKIQAQITRRSILLALPAVFLILSIILLAFSRNEVGLDVATILLGVLLIGGYDMLLRPLISYRSLLEGILHGLRHEMTDCTFSGMDSEASMVDNIRCYGLHVQFFENNKPYDRLFYLDAEKSMPDLTVGDPVKLVFHDRFLYEIQRV